MNNHWGRYGDYTEPRTYYFDDADVDDPVDALKSNNVLEWVGVGQSVEIADYVLADSMVYVGQQNDIYALSHEMSAIDPSRRVDAPDLIAANRITLHWQPYASMKPRERGAYLSWLATGRRDPNVPDGFASLYLCGLERRVFVDITGNRALEGELPLIRAEVAALIDAYGTALLYGQVSAFLDMLDLMNREKDISSNDPPSRDGGGWQVPIKLAVGLGRFVANRQPIPAEWALTWAWFRPDIPLRTPVMRCPEEFAALFRIRYLSEHDDGMKIRQGKTVLHVDYSPINNGLGRMSVDIGQVPDIFMRKAAGEILLDLVDRVTRELDPYSRWLARNVDRQGTLAALGQLPVRLLAEQRSDVKELLDWFERRLLGQRAAPVDPAEVLGLWSEEPVGKLSRADSLALARVFQRFDIGVEPDVRFGGAPISLGKPVVLYRLESPIEEAPSAAYPIATLMALMGAAVIAANGPIPAGKLAELVGIIALDDTLSDALPPSEMARLHAFLVGLAATEIRLTGLGKRIETLSEDECEATGDFLVAVATTDGAVSPATVTMMMKAFKVLGLDLETVTSRLHAALTGQRGNRRSSPGTSRSSRVPAAGRERTAGLLTLDQTFIDAKVRETSVVSDLLGSIFADDERGDIAQPASVASSQPEGAEITGVNPVAGLDLAHSRLLRAIAGVETCLIAEFASLAATYHLLAAGAIDVLNEAALDLTGDPLIDGEDLLIIDQTVFQEFFS
jgi:hypothetical protein